MSKYFYVNSELIGENGLLHPFYGDIFMCVFTVKKGSSLSVLRYGSHIVHTLFVQILLICFS